MKNRLDPFAERLSEWRAEGKTLKEVRALLKEGGCTSSISQIGDYCKWLEEEQRKKDAVDRVTSGARMVKALNAAYKQNPAPDIEAIMRTTRTLIWSLQTAGEVNPKTLSCVTAMQKALLKYLDDKATVALEARRVALSEDKWHFNAAEECYDKLDELKAIKASSVLTDIEKVEAIRVALFGESAQTQEAVT